MEMRYFLIFILLSLFFYSSVIRLHFLKRSRNTKNTGKVPSPLTRIHGGILANGRSAHEAMDLAIRNFIAVDDVLRITASTWSFRR